MHNARSLITGGRQGLAAVSLPSLWRPYHVGRCSFWQIRCRSFYTLANAHHLTGGPSTGQSILTSLTAPHYRDTVGGLFVAFRSFDLIRFASPSVGEPSRPGKPGLQCNFLDRSLIVGLFILFRAGVRFWVKGKAHVSRR
jgi:hypothetical protein